MIIPTIPWGSYIYHIGDDGPCWVSDHCASLVADGTRPLWFKCVEPEPGCLVRYDSGGDEGDSFAWECLRALSEGSETEVRSECDCLLPAVPPQHLWAALGLMLVEESKYGGPILRLETGAIHAAIKDETIITSASFTISRCSSNVMPSRSGTNVIWYNHGTLPMLAADYHPHMRDMQKYGALLEYIAHNGGESC